jgi:hypothetical protein
MWDVQRIAIGRLEMILPDIIKAVHGIAGVGNNDAGEEIEFTAQRNVEATAHVGTYNGLEILPGLLNWLTHLALDAVGHHVEGCENLHRGVGTEIPYYLFAFSC